MEDILITAAFTAAIDRLTKAAKKNGVDDTEVEAVFAAVLRKHWPQALLPGVK